MRVVDTSAWIEWLIGSDLGKTVAAHFPDRATWIVPTIVQMELAKWGVRNVSQDFADRVVGFTDKCVVALLDTKTALNAAEICIEHRLSTADAIIYATALAYGADLLTCDRHFQDLPHVHYIPKLPH
jgi:predicted nucleic acid-binding protein